jgi:sugar lactone lactonase YvrE
MLVLGIGVAACSPEQLGTADSPAPGGADSVSTVASDSAPISEGCENRATDLPWTSEVSATAFVLSEGGDAAPRVEAVVYPHPEYEGNPWTQWGQGLVSDTGRYFSGIGDHQGRDGNSYLFEYDPSTKTVTQIVDVLAIADHTPGDWGFGKIHAQMVQGPCDSILVTTYWGTRHDIEFTAGYRGDLLLSIDPQRRTVGTRGVVYPEHGVPSLAASPDGRLLYAEAVDPFGDDAGAFVVRNAADGTTVFVDDDPAHIGYRSIAVDADGRAFYSIGGGRLAVYDPKSNTRSALEAQLPGEWLRAVTEPDAQGTLYGVTRDPEVFFALDPDGTVRTLSKALGYTTSVALSPDGTTLYSVPVAHGGAWEISAPLMAVDTTTGEAEVVIELQPLAEEHLGMRLGGTYNVAFDKERRVIYLGMNASDMSDDSGFGEVVLMIVTLP